MLEGTEGRARRAGDRMLNCVTRDVCFCVVFFCTLEVGIQSQVPIGRTTFRSEAREVISTVSHV